MPNQEIQAGGGNGGNLEEILAARRKIVDGADNNEKTSLVKSSPEPKKPSEFNGLNPRSSLTSTGTKDLETSSRRPPTPPPQGAKKERPPPPPPPPQHRSSLTTNKKSDEADLVTSQPQDNSDRESLSGSSTQSGNLTIERQPKTYDADLPPPYEPAIIQHGRHGRWRNVDRASKSEATANQRLANEFELHSDDFSAKYAFLQGALDDIGILTPHSDDCALTETMLSYLINVDKRDDRVSHYVKYALNYLDGKGYGENTVQEAKKRYTRLHNAMLQVGNPVAAEDWNKLRSDMSAEKRVTTTEENSWKPDKYFSDRVRRLSLKLIKGLCKKENFNDPKDAKKLERELLNMYHGGRRR